jgi:hypothetical protein
MILRRASAILSGLLTDLQRVVIFAETTKMAHCGNGKPASQVVNIVVRQPRSMSLKERESTSGPTGDPAVVLILITSKNFR